MQSPGVLIAKRGHRRRGSFGRYPSTSSASWEHKETVVFPPVYAFHEEFVEQSSGTGTKIILDLILETPTCRLYLRSLTLLCVEGARRDVLWREGKSFSFSCFFLPFSFFLFLPLYFFF